MDDEATAWLTERLWQASLHIAGGSSFRGMKAFYPQSTEPYAEPMNAIPKAYFSRGGKDDALAARSLQDAARMNPSKIAEGAEEQVASWNDAPHLTGDLAGEIRRLKMGTGKPVLAHGGAGFARSLVATGLVDEFLLLIHPVVLGRGLSFFAGLSAPLALTLTDTRRFPSGVVAATYHPLS